MTVAMRASMAPLLLVLPFGMATAEEPFRIPLKFISNKDVKPTTPARLAVSMDLGSVTDARGLDDPQLLGESQARKPPVPVVSLTPIPEFVDEVLRASFTEWKVNTSSEADRILRCEILQVSVGETHRVNANVQLRFILEDRTGAGLWRGEVANDDSTWGRSLSVSNYQEVISTATKRTIADLLDKTDFREALTKSLN